jgi:penicillin-binding protein 1A
MTVRLAQEVGMQVIAEYAERFGVYDNMTAFCLRRWVLRKPALYRLVAAYAMFIAAVSRWSRRCVDRARPLRRYDLPP